MTGDLVAIAVALVAPAALLLAFLATAVLVVTGLSETA